jgi:murein DD-endopeptidase MepM/ murein hydrolase activator NlpD
MYAILATLFFGTLATGLSLVLSVFKLGLRSKIWRKFAIGYVSWLTLYFLFIALGTGPVGARLGPPATSPFKLPWKAGVARFVSQGNRSFTSHRGIHLYAWDFWMPIGTEVLAAREGTVLKIEQNFDGIGFNSNFVIIEHEDKTRAMYAHIKKNGAVVSVGDYVNQGQLIAYSGMVGQTVNPHLHFVVFNSDETASLPISFSDVETGVPLAGRSYTSGNVAFTCFEELKCYGR